MDLNDFVPAALTAFKWHGKQAALEIAPSPCVFMYRTDMYEELGLTVPKTMDNYKENIIKITNDSIKGVTITGKRGQSLMSCSWAMLLCSGPFHSERSPRTGDSL